MEKSVVVLTTTAKAEKVGRKGSALCWKSSVKYFISGCQGSEHHTAVSYGRTKTLALLDAVDIAHRIGLERIKELKNA